MSFIQSAFAAAPLHTREQVMAEQIAVAAELDMPDKPGAAICAGMCVSQEVGADPHGTGSLQFWTPGNNADPCFQGQPGMFPHDSMGDDSRSVGLYQQQTSGPPPAPQWGWGGLYGDPEGTRKRMDLHESTVLFLQALKRSGYDASSAQAANDSIQRVQKSGAPQAYTKHWPDVNALYDQVIKGVVVVDEKPGGGAVGWTGDPVWLEDVLRPALGDRLKVMPGWRDSGHGDYRDIRGVMVHHTGNSNASAQSIRDGRPDLAGPVSNLHIAPDGTVTIVAVGVCWHAGAGSYPWLPTNEANWHMIGIECAWPPFVNGQPDKAALWPTPQILSMRDTCAALCVKLQNPATRVIGHKEYAGSAQGKWDPGNMDMSWFRGEVAKKMRGEFEPKPPPPPVVPLPPPIVGPPSNPRSDRVLDEEVWDQLRGPGGHGWPQLKDMTVVDSLADAHRKLNAIILMLNKLLPEDQKADDT